MKTEHIVVEGGLCAKNQQKAITTDTKQQCCQSIDFIYLNERKSYVPLTSCVLLHILSSKLSSSAKLYYLLLDCFAHIEAGREGGKHARTTTKPATFWAKLLNKQPKAIYSLQQELEREGYVSIHRKRLNKKNERNAITPTLPAAAFKQLYNDNNTDKQHEPHLELKDLPPESERRKLLINHKLFIQLNFKLLTTIAGDQNLSTASKLLWLYCHYVASINYQDSCGGGSRSFNACYAQLASALDYSKSAISRAVHNLKKQNYLICEQISVGDANNLSNRKDFTINQIATLFPMDKMMEILLTPDRSGVATLMVADLERYKGCSAYSHLKNLFGRNMVLLKKEYTVSKTTLLSNRDPKTNILKNIYIEKESHEDNQQIKSEKVIIKNNKEISQPIETNIKFNEVKPKLNQEELANIEKELEIKQKQEPQTAKKQLAKILNSKQKTALTYLAFDLLQKQNKQIKNKKIEQAVKSLNSNKNMTALQHLLLSEAALPRYREIVDLSLMEKLNKESQEKFQKPKMIQNHHESKNRMPIPKELMKFEELNSLEPEKIIGEHYGKQIKHWVRNMRKNQQIKGEIAKLRNDEIEMQIAIHAKYWQPKTHCWDRIRFAIYIACQKIREGTWKSPHNVPLVRETIWLKQKHKEQGCN